MNRLSDGALQSLRDSVQYERKSIAEMGGAVTLALAELIERRAAEAAARAGADPDEIGNVDHAAWKRWRVEAGYPDHPWPELPTFGDMMAASPGALGLWAPCCEQPPDRHHEDMIDWADLRPEKRQKYIVQGMAAYESGRAAAQAEGARLRDALRILTAESRWIADSGDWSQHRYDWRNAIATAEATLASDSASGDGE